MIDVTAPSSKSLSHRYLIAAALADGVSTLDNVLSSDDTIHTRQILEAAGAVFIPQDSPSFGDCFRVEGVGGKLRGGTADKPISAFVNLSGTTCRLLTGVLATGDGHFLVSGAKRLEERPIGQLVDSMRLMGLDVAYVREEGYPPLHIAAHGIGTAEIEKMNALPGKAVPVSMDESSQYFSGLLLAAPLASAPITLVVSGSKVVSWPYIGLTLSCLSEFGQKFTVETRASASDACPWQAIDWRSVSDIRPGCLRVIVEPGTYAPGSFAVEGDWSGASYFVAAGVIGREKTRVRGIRTDSLQGDRALADIFRSMGASIESDAEGLIITPTRLHGVTVDMGQCPDLVPTVAAAAAFADGDTTITNCAHLRLKECDRIQAPAEGLRAIGARVEEHEDGLTVHGLGSDAMVRLGGITFKASNDHRMAMSQALYSLRATDVTPAQIKNHIDFPDVVKKSFPTFWQAWEAFC